MQEAVEYEMGVSYYTGQTSNAINSILKRFRYDHTFIPAVSLSAANRMAKLSYAMKRFWNQRCFAFLMFWKAFQITTADN